MTVLYDDQFYSHEATGTLRSAESIVPLLIDLLDPRSVVDVGCGTGLWLSVFAQYGVSVFGIDGDWITDDMLHIPRESFTRCDLGTPHTIEREFDLAISLEVAEHIDQQYADVFVQNIARLSAAILFSAAIPGQGGTHHVNEQWPEYWAEKFESLGYKTVDFIRPRVWKTTGVVSHYAQNCLLFVTQSVIDSNDRVAKAFQDTNRENLSLVHPSQFLSKARMIDNPAALSIVGVRVLSKALLRAAIRATRRLFTRR